MFPRVLNSLPSGIFDMSYILCTREFRPVSSGKHHQITWCQVRAQENWITNKNKVNSPSKSIQMDHKLYLSFFSDLLICFIWLLFWAAFNDRMFIIFFFLVCTYISSFCEESIPVFLSDMGWWPSHWRYQPFFLIHQHHNTDQDTMTNHI